MVREEPGGGRRNVRVFGDRTRSAAAGRPRRTAIVSRTFSVAAFGFGSRFCQSLFYISADTSYGASSRNDEQSLRLSDLTRAAVYNYTTYVQAYGLGRAS